MSAPPPAGGPPAKAPGKKSPTGAKSPGKGPPGAVGKKSPGAPGSGKKSPGAPGSGKSPTKAPPGGTKSPVPKKAPPGSGASPPGGKGPAPGTKKAPPAGGGKSPVKAPGGKSPTKAAPGGASPSSKAPPAAGKGPGKAPPAASAAAKQPAGAVPDEAATGKSPADMPTKSPAGKSVTAPPAAGKSPAGKAVAVPAGGKAPAAKPSSAGPLEKKDAPTEKEQVAHSMKFLIAGDEDVISDWKKKKIAVTVPMNMPIKPLVERQMLLRCQWESVNHVVPLQAKGADLNSLKPNRDEIIEYNLTPMQLKLQPKSMHWIWFRRMTEYDEPLKTAKEFYQERAKRFYEYYDPKNVSKAEANLADFEGKEELLFLKLVKRYGKEPTKEEWRRKTMMNADSGPLVGLGGTDKTAAGAALGGGASGLAASGAISASMGLDEGGMVAALMGRSSTSMMMLTYYKKWRSWSRKRKELQRVCLFMTGNISGVIRRDYFTKFKQFHATRKMKRQLQVSSQMAAKSESLVGDLNSTNVWLESEVKRLKAQVEVLDSANSKRLESLFSSSEAAIRQIKVLTQENEQKDAIINKLEEKLMNVGNLMLKANEDRDQQLQYSSQQRVALERLVEEMRQKQIILEENLSKANEQIEAQRPKTPPKACQHCPHYDDAVREAERLREDHKVLCEKIEDVSSEKYKLQAALENMQTVVAAMKSKIDDLQNREQQLQATLLERGQAIPAKNTDATGNKGTTAGLIPPNQNPEKRLTFQEDEIKSQLSGGGAQLQQGVSPSRAPSESSYAVSRVEDVIQSRGAPVPAGQQHLQGAPQGQHQGSAASVASGGPQSSGNPIMQRQISTGSGGINNYSQYYGGSAGGGGQQIAVPPQGAPQQQQQQQQQRGGDLVYDASGIGRPIFEEKAQVKANTSLESFFEKEERLAREKMKMFLDRHAQQKVGGISAHTPRPTGVSSFQVQQALAHATSLDRHPVAAAVVEQQTLGSAGIGGVGAGPGAGSVGGISTTRFNQGTTLASSGPGGQTGGSTAVPVSSSSLRPQTDATHNQYNIGPTTSTNRHMMSSVFAFKK